MHLSEYPLYFRQLFRNHGWKAVSKQFRAPYLRPFSRALLRKHSPTGRGIEIGVGAYTIAPTRRTLLTDGFHAHGDAQSIATQFCRADDIPATDASFSFVLSEHVLEHLSDPIKALQEWKRVLVPHGKVILFLPHRDRTFDRMRARTTLAHLIADHANRVPDEDPTHLQEWKEKVIDTGLAPHYLGTPVAEHARLGLIHHHVWIPEDMVELLTYAGFRVIEVHDLVLDRNDSFVVIAET